MTLSDRDWARLVRIYRTGPSESEPTNGDDVEYMRAVATLAIHEYGLTQTEYAVAVRLAFGESPALIAQTRKVSANTVKAQVHHIYEVARVANRAEFQADVLKRALRIAAVHRRTTHRR